MKRALECQEALISRFPAWEALSLPALFDIVAQTHPDRPAILSDAGSWSYARLAMESKALAAAIIASGIPAGSRIAVVMANFPEFLCVKLAIARSGCVAVPINFQLRLDELTYVIDQAECCLIFGMGQFRDRNYLSDFATLLMRCDALKFAVVRDTPGLLPDGIICLERFAASAGEATDAALAARQSAVHADDMSDIVYTSGTTGRPKGAMLTHDMLLRSAFSSALTRAFEDGRRILFALPMYHVFGYVECWVATLFVGGAIIPQPVFDADQMIEYAEAYGATDIVCVPVMTHALIGAIRKRGGFVAPLRAFFNSGGVNVPSVWDDIKDVLGVSEIHTAYGMTETTASTMCTRSGESLQALLATNGQYKIAGASGDVALGGRVALYRVVDPATGVVLNADCPGELQVRGPVVTTGYYRKTEETEAAFTSDGWFRTGDVGQLSADGHLTLTGRIKESYRCGGEMVMPREIEVLLEDYPGLAQVLVVGVPDSRMGEVGCLCVVPNHGASFGDAELISYCRAKLARFKVPKHVLRLEAADIPLTATGRPQKFALAQLARTRLGLD